MQNILERIPSPLLRAALKHHIAFLNDTCRGKEEDRAVPRRHLDFPRFYSIKFSIFPFPSGFTFLICTCAPPFSSNKRIICTKRLSFKLHIQTRCTEILSGPENVSTMPLSISKDLYIPLCIWTQIFFGAVCVSMLTNSRRFLVLGGFFSPIWIQFEDVKFI